MESSMRNIVGMMLPYFNKREEMRRHWRRCAKDAPFPVWLVEPDPSVGGGTNKAVIRLPEDADEDDMLAAALGSSKKYPAEDDDERIRKIFGVPSREEKEKALLLMDQPKPWGPLPGREPPGPFPLDALPELARKVAVTVADSVQVSPGMSACMVLGALSAAAVGRAGVRLAEDYEEPCHLYVAIGANPSERKSACLNLVFSSLYRYEQEEDGRRAPAVRQYEEMREMLKDQLARAKKADERQQVADLVDELARMEEVKPFELILSDVTTEALTRAMAQNDGRMALVSAEGVFLSTLAGAYSTSGVANVDVVLKGYSGEPVKVDRIGRSRDRIPRACLSLCLAVQPEMLVRFLTDPTLAGRGMASRFLAALPDSLVGSRTSKGVPVDFALMERFASRLERILRSPDPLTLTLSPAAAEAHRAWHDEIEAQLKPGGSMANLAQGWGGKLCGNTVRVAGLLHLLVSDSLTVDGDTMRGEIRVARWFRAQAMRLISGNEELSPEANDALSWLVRRGELRIGATLVRNALRKRKPFPRMEVAIRALNELEDAGYIRQTFTPRRAGAGRPEGPMIELHPGLLSTPAA